MRCACRRPKPVEVTDDLFDGLFIDTPVTSEQWPPYCGGCGRDLEVRA